MSTGLRTGNRVSFLPTRHTQCLPMSRRSESYLMLAHTKHLNRSTTKWTGLQMKRRRVSYFGIGEVMAHRLAGMTTLQWEITCQLTGRTGTKVTSMFLCLIIERRNSILECVDDDNEKHAHSHNHMKAEEQYFCPYREQ